MTWYQRVPLVTSVPQCEIYQWKWFVHVGSLLPGNAKVPSLLSEEQLHRFMSLFMLLLAFRKRAARGLTSVSLQTGIAECKFLKVVAGHPRWCAGGFNVSCRGEQKCSCRVALHCDRHMPSPRAAGQVSALADRLELSQCPRSSFSSGGSGPDRIIKRLAGQRCEKDVMCHSRKPPWRRLSKWVTMWCPLGSLNTSRGATFKSQVSDSGLDFGYPFRLITWQA